MRTFLVAYLYLLPFITFTIFASAGEVASGAWAGLAVAVVWSCWRYGAHLPSVFLLAQILALTLIVIAQLMGWQVSEHLSLTLLFTCLALGATLSVMMKKPWTSDMSAAGYSSFTDHPVFLKINMIMSTLWAMIYAWFAFATWQAFPELSRWIPLAAGGLVSIVGPGLLVNRELNKLLAGDTRNNWPPPNFKTARHSSKQDDDSPSRVDVAVIGAGIGGLTAAALLADRGLSVAVYEQHNVPGGFAHHWLRRCKDPVTGDRLLFRFDSGVHDVSGAHPTGSVDALLQRLGLHDEIQWQRLDQRYVNAQRTIDVPRNWRDYVSLLSGEFPDQAQGIESLFEDLHAIYVGMYSQSEHRSGIPGAPLTTNALMQFAEEHPLFTQWMDRPWSELLNHYISDLELRNILSTLAQYITHDPDTLTVHRIAPIFGYYFNGGYYPVGGSGQLANVLVKGIEDRGGQVHLHCAVTQITVHQSKATGLNVIDRHGQEQHIEATAIVSNMDAKRLVETMIAAPSVRQSVSAAVDQQVGSLTPACSAVGVHLGVRGDVDLPPIIHGETAAGTLYMVSPSSVDSGAAPDGYSTLELLSIIDHEPASQWFGEHTAASAQPQPGAHNHYRDIRESDKYTNHKAQANESLLAAARTLIPDLDERIVYRTDSSPVTFARYTWTSDGAIYGTTMSNGLMPSKTPLENLVVAGAMTHGAGVEAVMISGAYAAEALLPGCLSTSWGPPRQGVYVDRGGKLDRFAWVKAPRTAQLSQLTHTIAHRIGRYLERQGLLAPRRHKSVMASRALWHWTSPKKTR